MRRRMSLFWLKRSKEEVSVCVVYLEKKYMKEKDAADGSLAKVLSVRDNPERMSIVFASVNHCPRKFVTNLLSHTPSVA